MQAHRETIEGFIQQSAGLECRLSDTGQLQIHQQADGKVIDLWCNAIDDVLERMDSQGQAFLQVNFIDGRKILLTDRLIGFKPAIGPDLDVKKLPKVVTTPDLVSVVEAIEESMSAGPSGRQELDLLRRVFDSVLEGGEAVGFDLTQERTWVNSIVSSNHKASA